MKYFSMFSGIGGFELGIQNAYGSEKRGSEKDSQGNQKQGLFTKTSKSLSAKNGRTGQRTSDEFDERPLCIGYSEIDKYADKVYQRQFKGHTNYGDATTINAKELPDFDLLVGGFPCQAFSVAGKRGGFNDTRGTLFFDIARILAEKRPRHLLLENVKGLLSHDKGKTFQTILGVLSDLGYRVEWRVLNSKDFGVPQNRERIFIIGHLRGECGGQILPITGTDTKDTGQFVDLTRRQPDNHKARKDGRAGTLDANYYKGLANQERPGVKEGTRIRRLTPKECERLQGFPDDWTKYGVGDEPISDTQRYKMCGNAVTVNVIEAIFNNFHCLEVE